MNDPIATGPQAPAPASPRLDPPRLGIGIGIDLHRLEPGRPCRLAGVDLPAPVGPVGHSDGDVILHALCDAVLGAAGLDDLGTLFSDRDPRHAGRDSREFCRETMALLARAGVQLLSLDVVVETELPKLAPHRATLRTSIAELFRLTIHQVNLKGKTGEKLDAVGRGEAIRATAVALVQRPVTPAPEER